VRRKELKPRKPQTDENLLAAAMRDAEKWQEQLRRTRNTWYCDPYNRESPHRRDDRRGTQDL